MKKDINNFKRMGQPYWLEGFSRPLLLSGNFKGLIDELGFSGAIFNVEELEGEIYKSLYYEEDISAMTRKGLRAPEIFGHIVGEDLHIAAQELWPVYLSTDGDDGYVCAEVPANYLEDINTIYDSVLELLDSAGNPANLCVDIPGTQASHELIYRLTAKGVSVNASMLFSVDQYVRSANAYWEGLRDFIDSGGDPQKVASFATFFLNRIDGYVDKEIDRLYGKGEDTQTKERLADIRGKAALSVARLAYGIFQDLHSSEEWRMLEAKGGRKQKIIWGRTTATDPSYGSIKYTSSVYAKDTIVSMSMRTIDALKEQGIERGKDLREKIAEARSNLDELGLTGLNYDDISESLQKESLFLSEESYDNILEAIEEIVGKQKAA